MDMPGTKAAASFPPLMADDCVNYRGVGREVLICSSHHEAQFADAHTPQALLNFQALHLLLVIRSLSSSISNGDSENKVLPLVFEKRIDCLVSHVPVFGKSIG